jgi:hypothetical protein
MKTRKLAVMMEEAIKHGGDGGAISQQLAPVLDGSV